MSNVVRCNCGNPDCNNYVFTDEGALHAVKRAHGRGSGEEVRIIPGANGWLKLISLIAEELRWNQPDNPLLAARVFSLMHIFNGVVDWEWDDDRARQLKNFVRGNGLVFTGQGFDANYYETAVVHPLYNDGLPIIVDAYGEWEHAVEGHNAWVEAMNAHPQPYSLKDLGDYKYNRQFYSEFYRGGE